VERPAGRYNRRIPESVDDITTLLVAWGRGDEAALQQLIPLVHRELHQIARRCLKGERPGHTLQPTALVNEAYLRLIDVRRVSWKNRTHFLAMSARLMRRVLVDFARSRQYQKRGGGVLKVSLDEAHGLDRTRSGSCCARRGAHHPVGNRREEDARGRDAVLRRPHRRGNRRGPRRVARHCPARLASGPSLVDDRAPQISVSRHMTQSRVALFGRGRHRATAVDT
jgi:DNA-directed RNA polymerase specialized sigma24 family protein